MNTIARVALPTTVLLLCAAAPLHEFLAVAISPDGARVASIEGDQDASGVADTPTVVIRPVDGGAPGVVSLPCGQVHDCTPSSLAWRPDGSELDFVLRSPGTHARAIYAVRPDGTNLHKVMDFNGTLGALKFGRDGRLAMLAVQNAAKEVGAVEAGAAQTGELGTDVHEQRLAILQPDNTLHFASPGDLYVYEYDWRPDGSGFVGTAAPGDGDNNWWVAKLYSFDAASGGAQVIYSPTSAQQQLAQPRVAPDGHYVSFIGGLMSDFGATGGDALVMVLDRAGAAPVDLSAGWHASVTGLEWACDGHGLLATTLAGDRTELVPLDAGRPSPAPATPLASSADRLSGSQGGVSQSCTAGRSATVHQTFVSPPEIEAGTLGHWQDVTHSNAGQSVNATMRSLSWRSDGFTVQGWLLLPGAASGKGKLGMITEVHGGPASANEPNFVGEGSRRQLLDAGYALLLPNPRGSFGQGEAFTRANVKDFGYGDLRDILAGVDAAERAAPIDDNRLGLTGWSYGGYMTMFAVTQTNRFHAAVAGAGLSDWLSYYGENGIDAWMIPYFGASVYDDPAVYAKSSPMSFIRQVRTPTLSVVGENDIECPAPQTMEFYHALHELGVPSAAVIYPGEGHRIHDPAHIADIDRRTLAWFNKYLARQ